MHDPLWVTLHCRFSGRHCPLARVRTRWLSTPTARGRSSSPRPTSRSASRRSSRCSTPRRWRWSIVFEGLKQEADQDDMLVDAVAGELIASEVEIRSGKGEQLRATRSTASTSGAGACSRSPPRGTSLLGATGTHPWSPWQDQRDHRHAALPPRRGRAAVRRVAQQHLQQPRARRRAAAPTAPSPSATRCGRCCRRCSPRRRTRPFVEGVVQRTALGPHRDLHAHVPALRDARPLRQLGGVRALRRLPVRHQLDHREHPDLVERATAPSLRHGRGADHGCAVVRGRVDRRCWRWPRPAWRRRRSTTTRDGDPRRFRGG